MHHALNKVVCVLSELEGDPESVQGIGVRARNMYMGRRTHMSPVLFLIAIISETLEPVWFNFIANRSSNVNPLAL